MSVNTIEETNEGWEIKVTIGNHNAEGEGFFTMYVSRTDDVDCEEEAIEYAEEYMHTESWFKAEVISECEVISIKKQNIKEGN